MIKPIWILPTTLDGVSNGGCIESALSHRIRHLPTTLHFERFTAVCYSQSRYFLFKSFLSIRFFPLSNSLLFCAVVVVVVVEHRAPRNKS
ncbi:hypothetical protein VNO78_31802 [Psophocarpus tetragonolobus]|uniref:Uncharacterized protein n=1 Tax=Psophocarpus tetragonolobus TaxID=3891 RepID=A0AAN9X7M6_PSOTE